MDKEVFEHSLNINRRHFFKKAAMGMGGVALGSLMVPDLFTGSNEAAIQPTLGLKHFASKAKRIIMLTQNGAPSQLESFDYKPKLRDMFGQELPDSVRGEQRLTGMTANQNSYPLVGSKFDFKQHGDSGMYVSDLFPNIAKITDDICMIKSMHTDAINHDPALTFLQTGSQVGSRPSMGSWLSYGLGSENKNLPAFTVLLSKGKGNGQGVYSKLWGNGFLDSIHQGVQLSASEDPILYLKNPNGMDADSRRKMLNHLGSLNEIGYQEFGDPEIQAKIKQYEMAYRMQTAVPEITDVSKEPDHIKKMYGSDSMIPGTYAANCLLARKLSESGVRFVQLYHQGWDQHSNLVDHMKMQAKDVDQASAALITDLKQRGLLDETLVIWGGEFGRTNYCQGKLTNDNYGRDHHPRCYSLFMAGGGVKAGTSYGKTDELGYNIVENPVHIHDLQATIMHLMGLDHEKLTYKHLGRRFRLTDVHGHVVKDIIA
ncbi:DUF1501 domain-containing protein [Flavicella sediminum]|uniref:DUF1501 domain-containing protein n=1 Tax=Flavicella sediminum TaxID=2585141 RepID=UPI00112345AA|nr:DUF1501 domain-containing protein [Flavicella sediminum]